MNSHQSQSSSCCGSIASLGGVRASDFAALDRLAVKLICLDSAFAAPLRQMGFVIGERIATESAERTVSLDKALSAVISACGLEEMVTPRFPSGTDGVAVLQITACEVALGCEVPRTGRAVCGFDVGLFEGFVRGVTGDAAWIVEETACLGFGNSCCEFTIRRQCASGVEGGLHDCC